MILPSLLVPLKSTADNNSAIDLIVLAAFCRFLPLPHWPICCNERQKAGEPPPHSPHIISSNCSILLPPSGLELPHPPLLSLNCQYFCLPLNSTSFKSLHPRLNCTQVRYPALSSTTFFHPPILHSILHSPPVLSHSSAYFPPPFPSSSLRDFL